MAMSTVGSRYSVSWVIVYCLLFIADEPGSRARTSAPPQPGTARLRPVALPTEVVSSAEAGARSRSQPTIRLVLW